MINRTIDRKRHPIRSADGLLRIEAARHRILAVIHGHVVEHSGQSEGPPLSAWAGLFSANLHTRSFGKPGHDATPADWEECADWAEGRIVYDEEMSRRRDAVLAAGVVA